MDGTTIADLVRMRELTPSDARSLSLEKATPRLIAGAL
jgi:hypothetical protein